MNGLYRRRGRSIYSDIYPLASPTEVARVEEFKGRGKRGRTWQREGPVREGPTREMSNRGRARGRRCEIKKQVYT